MSPPSRRRRFLLEALEQRRLLASIVVNTELDIVNSTDQFISLREAISAANASSEADEITFAQSLDGVPITLTRAGVAENLNAFGDLDFGSGTVSLRGNGRDKTIISGGGDAGIGESVFNLVSAANVTMENLTIRDGRGNIGGGIAAQTNSSGSLLLNNVRLIGNSATNDGGAIAIANSSTVTIQNSLLENNRAARGGAIASFGVLTVQQSTLTNNTATASGGGIQAQDQASNVRVESSTLNSNTAGFGGGGITNLRGNVAIVNSTLSGNRANNSGAAVFTVANVAGQAAATSIDFSTITGNVTAGSGTGVVHAQSESVNVSTVVTLSHTIMVGNDGFDGPPALNNITFANVAGGAGVSVTSRGFNIFDDNAFGVNVGSDRTNVTVPVINTALADNGGPTMTHALIDRASNPAIDGGNGNEPKNLDGNPIVYDQRGAPYSRVDGGVVDIGAVEHLTFDEVDFVVNSGADTLLLGDAEVTLRDAIFASNLMSGIQEITFAASVGSRIVLQGGELEISDSVTITGPGAALLTIDANEQSRILNILSGEVTVNGLTLTGGRIEGDNAGFDDTTFAGGAIRSVSALPLTIRDSVLIDNQVAGVFSRGGAVATANADLQIVRTVVTENRAMGFNSFGGAIHSRSGAVTLVDSSLTDNDVGEIGGGVGTFSGSVSIIDSTVTGNSAGRGGGIGTTSGSVTLTNITLAGNRAIGGDGGGLWTDDSTVRIINSTVTGNSASSVGGGLGIFADDFNDDERLTIHNSIIAGNSDNGTAPDFRAPGDPANDLVVRSSLIGNTSGTSLTPDESSGNVLNVDWRSVLENDGTAPILRNNGGLTETIALVPGENGSPNPAINAGNNDLALDANNTFLISDQRGVLFLRILNSTVDMGAYEFAPATHYIVSTTEDVVDNDLSDGNLSLREAILLSNASKGQADTISFSEFITTPIVLQLGELAISDSATITGLDSKTTIIDAKDASRIFNIDDGTAGLIDVTISGMTVTQGASAEPGGAIYSSENLTLSQVTVSDSTSSSTDFLGGGGVFARDGLVVINGSTFHGNSVTGSSGEGAALRGRFGTTLVISGSTFSGNESSTVGGAISASGITRVEINNSTIANNTGQFGALFVFNVVEGTVVRNSIIADNIGSNTSFGRFPDFDFGSAGSRTFEYSLIEDGDSITGTGNILGQDPDLRPLADNGGSTLTVALLPDSPAIDRGNGALLPSGATNDQRGVARTIDLPNNANAIGGDGTDIGAVEMLGLSIADVAADEEAGTLAFTITISNAIPIGHSVTVRFDTADIDGQATVENDYTAVVNRTLTFNGGGALTQRVSVPIINDDEVEADETFSGNLSFAGGAIITRAIAIATINDSDVAASLDFGDAPSAAQSGFPASYPVTLAQHGARHAVGSLFLGSSVDTDTDGVPSRDASSDSGDDGVFVLADMVASATSATISSFSVIVSASGRLDAWIDFNQDGDWLDLGEQIFTSVPVAAGSNVLNYQIPAGAKAGDTGARFRLSTSGGLASTGEADSGEVEDYIATILDGGSPVAVQLDLPSGGTSRIETVGDKVHVVRSGVTLFAAPAAALSGLQIMGTVANEILQVTSLPSDRPFALKWDAAGGNDTLRLDGGVSEFDLTTVPAGGIANIETVDLGGDGATRLSINAAQLPTTSSGSPLLLRLGLGDSLDAAAGWRITDSQVVGGEVVRTGTFGQTATRVQFVSAAPFQNALNPLDVNGDGLVQPIDALVIINALQSGSVIPRSGSLPDPTTIDPLPTQFFDTDGDNIVKPIDALRIINALSRPVGGGSEGEAASNAEWAMEPLASSELQDLEDDERRWLIDQVFEVWSLE